MTADLGQIESVTIQLQVYNRLREALFTGKLLPGESLTIRNLAAMLGTSPMPVREALQRLVAEHALTQLPNRTFCVTPFTAAMFRELMRVRMAVEGLAANQAVRRITPETIARLREINLEMKAGVEEGVPTAVMTANCARAPSFTNGSSPPASAAPPRRRPAPSPATSGIRPATSAGTWMSSTRPRLRPPPRRGAAGAGPNRARAEPWT